MIGSNILWYSQDFMTAYETLQNDLAVHTVCSLRPNSLEDNHGLGTND